MTTARLGNSAPHQGRKDENGEPVLDDNGQRAFFPIELDAPTEVLVSLSPQDTLMEQFRAIEDLWRYHSSAPPSWVWSDSAALQGLLAEQFHAPAGLPDDVEATHYTHSGPPGSGGEG
jgi:hypothetical protein